MDHELTRRRALAGGAALLAGSLAGCSALTPFVGKYTESERTLAVGEAERLAADVDVGDVAITGTDRDDVHVRSVKTASGVGADLSNLDLSIRRGEGTLTLVGSYAASSGCLCQPRLDLTVEVPRALPVSSVVTGTGDVTLERTTGDPSVETSTGRITARHVRGDVDAVASTGDVTVRGAGGRVTAETGTGDVIVRDPGVVGDLSTSTGDVTADVPAIAGDTRLGSETGDVEAAVAPDLDADLVARTEVGEVRVSGLGPAAVERDEDPAGSTVRGTIGDGGPRLVLETETGDVRVEALA